MKKYIANYLNAHSLTQADWIACEICETTAVDIHHKIYGRFKRSDESDNLIALCRACHIKVHNGVIKL